MQAALAIQNEREKNGKFKSLDDFVKRVDVHLVNRKVYETLIKCDALCDFGYTESTLLSSLDAILSHASNYQKETLSGQIMLFDSVSDDDISNTSLIIEKQVEYPSNILMENEKEVLGFSLRYHPFSRYINKIDYKYFNNLLEIDSLNDKDEFIIPAVVINIAETNSKKNTPIIMLKVMDLFTDYTFYITSKNQIDKFREILEEQIGVLIKGRKEKNRFSNKIYVNIVDIRLLDYALSSKNTQLKEIKRDIIKRDNQVQFQNNLSNNDNIYIENNEEKDIKHSNNIVFNDTFTTNINSTKKQLSLCVNKNVFDDMDLLCLQNAISSNPGEYTIFLKLKSESGTEVFKIGEDYKVDPSQRFLNETKNTLRSLIQIEYA